MKRTIPQEILIIQTAFIGDVILSTAMIEKLKFHFSEANIDFVTKTTNHGVLKSNPHLGKIVLWNKHKGKYKNLLKVIKEIRKKDYDIVINIHRFGSSGLMTAFAKASYKIGYKKNPWAFCFNEKVRHKIGDGTHEVDRVLSLIVGLTDQLRFKPKIYLSEKDLHTVDAYKSEPYITIAPASIWFTKQYPKHKWVSLIEKAQFNGHIYLLGAPSDYEVCQDIKEETSKKVTNLAGTLSLLESAALMKDAQMNYVNDSAPMHLCSATNAPVTVIYCSTVPEFGFGPLSDNATVVQTKEQLSCRPCGLHGHKECPEGHFKCTEVNLKIGLF